MRVVVQKVLKSSVTVDNKLINKIDKGLMVLVGFTDGDTIKDIEYMAKKVANLRIFEDENDKMNLSIHDVNGNLKMKDMDYIGPFSQGLAVVGSYNKRTKKTLYGYTDLNLGKAIAPVYDKAEDFRSDGTATVVYKGETGIIDKSNKRVG